MTENEKFALTALLAILGWMYYMGRPQQVSSNTLDQGSTTAPWYLSYNAPQFSLSPASSLAAPQQALGYNAPSSSCSSCAQSGAGFTTQY